MARMIWDVEPRPDGWAVQREGTSRAGAIFESKSDAEDRARELAQSVPLGQVRVKDNDGKIVKEWTYPPSSDPRRTRG